MPTETLDAPPIAGIVHPHAQAILDSLGSTGSAAWSLHRGDLTGTNNYIAGTHPETSTQFRGEVTPEHVTDFIQKHEALLEHPQSALGAYRSPDGTTRLEVAGVTPSRTSATQAAPNGPIHHLKSGEIVHPGPDTPDPPANLALQDAANLYNIARGRAEIGGKYLPVDPRSTQLVSAYNSLQHSPHDPAVQRSYDALKTDIKDQWNHALGSGYTLEPHAGQAYQQPTDLLSDVAENKHLFIEPRGSVPLDHPLRATDADTGLTYNEMLHGVHALYGHAGNGYGFDEKGKENAWFKHQQMFSDDARGALAMETRGENHDGKAAVLPNTFTHRQELNRFDQLDPGPEQEAIKLRHYAAEKAQGDVLSGDRRATSPDASRNEAARRALPDFQPGVAFYRDGTTAGRHPLVSARKFEYPLQGKYAIAEIESNPAWQKAMQEAQQASGGANDPKHFLLALNHAEKAIRDTGYDGYTSKAHPESVLMFGDHSTLPKPPTAAPNSFVRLGVGKTGLASGRDMQLLTERPELTPQSQSVLTPPLAPFGSTPEPAPTFEPESDPARALPTDPSHQHSITLAAQRASTRSSKI